MIVVYVLLAIYLIGLLVVLALVAYALRVGGYTLNGTRWQVVGKLLAWPWYVGAALLERD